MSVLPPMFSRLAISRGRPAPPRRPSSGAPGTCGRTCPERAPRSCREHPVGVVGSDFRSRSHCRRLAREVDGSQTQVRTRSTGWRMQPSDRAAICPAPDRELASASSPLGPPPSCSRRRSDHLGVHLRDHVCDATDFAVPTPQLHRCALGRPRCVQQVGHGLLQAVVEDHAASFGGLVGLDSPVRLLQGQPRGDGQRREELQRRCGSSRLFRILRRGSRRCRRSARTQPSVAIPWHLPMRRPLRLDDGAS